MIIFGPVAEAANGGHGSPAFDLFVGFGVLALTWVGYSKRAGSGRATLLTALGVSAICAVFIVPVSLRSCVDWVAESFVIVVRRRWQTRSL